MDNYIRNGQYVTFTKEVKHGEDTVEFVFIVLEQNEEGCVKVQFLGEAKQGQICSQKYQGGPEMWANRKDLKPWTTGLASATLTGDNG